MRIIEPPLSLYHGTKFEHVSAILASGIKNVGSAWGQGELGAGFYTATKVAGGAAYLEGPGGVIEFEVTRQLKGADVTPPAKFDWSGTGRLDEITRLCTAYDYLVSSTDIPVSQIKLNFGRGTDNVKAVAVHLLEKGGWKRYTKQEYEDLF